MSVTTDSGLLDRLDAYEGIDIDESGTTVVINDHRQYFQVVVTGDIDARDQSQHADRGGSTGGVAEGNTGSVIAQGGSAAGGDKSKVTRQGDLSGRAARAPWWSKLLGVLSILLLIGTIVYVILSGWEDKSLVVGGFVLAAVAVAGASVPLFRE